MLASKSVSQIYEFGPFRLDAATSQLFSNGKPVPLEPKVFQTLLILVRNWGRLVDRDELMSEIWPDSFVEDTNLARNISILRKALGKAEDGSRYIETIPKRGYRFVGKVTQPEFSDDDNTAALDPQTDPVAGSGQTGSWKSHPTPLPSSAESPNGRSRLILLPRSGFGQIRRGVSSRRKLGLGTLALAIALASLAATLYLIKNRSGNAWTVPGVRSIAVLPFKPADVDKKEEYLGLSLTDALVTNLGPVAHISVRPTSAVRRYQAETRDPVEIGRELNVDMVVAGQFRKAGSTVEVTVQLITAKDGASLWSGQFREAEGNLFNLESSISQQVVKAVGMPSSEGDHQHPAPRTTDNGEAYQHYLRGRYLWNRRNTEDLMNAEAEFERAIQLDPNYAQAYAGLADCHLLLGNQPGVQPDMALKALQLDDTLAEAHASLAYRESALDWNWTDAEIEFQRAIKLNPSYVTAHHWYAYHLATMGRLEEALSEISKAQQLDPLSSIINTDVAHILYISRRYDEAIAKCLKVLETDPSFSTAHVRLAEAYAEKQMHKQAIAEFRKALDLDPRQYIPMLAYAYAKAGQRDEALKILADFQPTAEVRNRSTDVALIYSGLNWKDLAFEWLEKAFKTHEGYLALLQVEPKFDNLRSDPRYLDLLRRMNLRP
jgi:DNA-binding winged helix-turn-helix (wHTH) protein/TolB-like protein/Tfp pilus assembly protein PilF